MIEVEYIDLSRKINSIVYKKRQGTNAENYDRSKAEANEIWQFTLDDEGCVILNELIRLGEKYNNYAEIRIAKGGNGLFAVSTAYMLPNQGSFNPLSVFERIGFKTKEEAKIIAIQTLQQKLTKIIENGHSENADKVAAKQLVNLLENEKKPQFSLF